MELLSQDRFRRDGYAIADSLIDPAEVPGLHDAFERLFRGEFRSRGRPDEFNWQFGPGNPAHTRQICNGWKADPDIAAVVLDPKFGSIVAKLMGWPGVRLIQDNILWKPPGAAALGFHRDNDYSHWFTPAEMATCWIALDDTSES